MKNFDDWFIELIDDEIWHEHASRFHKKETFEKVANQVYVLGISDSQAFSVVPMREHRNHVYNKICKLPPDKVKKDWVAEAIKKHESEKVETAPPLTGEERAKRIKELLEVVQSAQAFKPVAPISHKEMLENSDWRPKPETIREPSEIEKRAALNAHLEKISTARRKLFLEAYPDASEEEIQAYINKFQL